jgi:hypothetical protein
MKKLFYLCAYMATAIAFVSCNKLGDTYKAIDAVGPAGTTLNYTLTPTDYAILPTTVPASKSHSFLSTTDANTNIPTILNYKFFNYATNSSANITFNSQPVLPDSVFKDESYTLTTTPANDYTLLPGNKFADFSVAQILTWLPYKFTAPAPNQMYVLTWIFYPTLAVTAPQIYPGVSLSTTGSVTTATGSFLYLNGTWIQAYQITPAQYATVGRGQYNQFTSSDDANIPSYFNTLLKADPAIAATATTGTVQYVSFNYYNAAKATDQRILAMTYNGTNWVTSAASTLIFVKTSTGWIPDPSIYYTLTKTDTQLIGNPNGTNNTTIGTTAQRANLYSYGDFSGWAVADIDKAIILVLTTDFPTPKVGLNYKVTFLNYTGGADVPTTYVFSNNGTTWTAAQ